MQRAAGEVVDQKVPAQLVWSGSTSRVAADLAAAPPIEQLHLLRSFVAAQPGTVDLLAAAVAQLSNARSDRVAVVAEDLGVSERQLRRRTIAAVGYGPMTLARVSGPAA